jgi:hypothetical protein
VSELVPRREETRAHCRRQLSSVRSRGVERWRRGERVRAGPAARRDPGAAQFKNRVRSRGVERWRSVSELVPRREETRAHHSSRVGYGREAWSGEA